MGANDTSRIQATLDDKYTIESGTAFMTGIQALVRLPLEQKRRDRAAGLNTAGYVSGYQGSPLAALDGSMRRAKALMDANDIVFRAGVNEELAATAVWGTQYVNMFPGAKFDGVFGIWYAKAPGIDRSVDALRHAHWAGTSRTGGTLALAGDDHGAKSTTVASYSDVLFESVGMPVLYPASVQEVLDFGLHGLAMSRFASVWVAMKLVTDIVESAGLVRISPDSPIIHVPQDHPFPPDGLAIRPVELAAMVVEERLYSRRLYAALAYARANDLNRITHAAPAATIGVISAGKSYQDLRKALADLGLDGDAITPGVRVLKLGMVWPVEPQIVREFAKGLDTVVVVEEKRPLIENQVRSILYGAPGAPRVLGKAREGNLYDATPDWLFPTWGEIRPATISQILVSLLDARGQPHTPWTAPAPLRAANAPAVMRTPSFCSGCPHNRSTKLPAGSRALAGIGCHGMQVLLDPANCKTVAQMGGEGMHWVGQQPFTSERHVFANIGDGTYAHSGSLAIRQAVAVGAPVTYKLLVNGFVSMTGGQDVIGGQSVTKLVDGLRADGVERIVVVTDDIAKYANVRFAQGVPLLPREEMPRVQAELREYPGVSVIIYEQPCATERRRLRKQGKWEDPAKRTFIASEVCEGCGDCGKASTCLSIEPLDTEFGRKRRINQSSCNKDFTCVEGFCPSLVTVHGGQLRKPATAARAAASAAAGLVPFEVPTPTLPTLSRPYNVLVGGIGGTGVITIGQVLAMAAYLDGTAILSLDVMGMAQKYGAVFSHLHFAGDAAQLTSPRIAAGDCDALIACDLIVSSGDEPVSMLGAGRTRAVVCTDVIPTAEFARNTDWNTDPAKLLDRITSITGEATTTVDGQRLAVALIGDAIANNMLMLGAAWQLGMVPLSLAAIDRAIELNGVQVPMNRAAFAWGRCIAHDPARVDRMASGGQVIEFVRRPVAPTLDETVARRVALLTDYQDAAYARRYQDLVDEIRREDAEPANGQRLSAAVADSYFKLLAVKDEWEVARLFCGETFRREIEQAFEGDYELHFHLGAWPFARKDPATGQIRKRELGPWVMTAFKMMSRLRGLRGGWLDPFRGGAERTLDRTLLAQYEQDVRVLVAGLSAGNYAAAVAWAALPAKIRGFGHVRQASVDAIAPERERLMREFSNPDRQALKAG